MGIVGTLRHLKLKHKLLLPNTLYLILFAAVLFFFIKSNELIKGIAGEQQASFTLSEKVRQAAFDTKAFIKNEISFAEIEREYEEVLSGLKQGDLAQRFTDLRKRVAKINELRGKNRLIEEKVMELTSSSLAISNQFIKLTAERLADETTRKEVTVLETLTIIGANINTSTNYELQVLFGRLKESLAIKDQILKFIDKLLENVENDIKKLAGTPFEKMPVDARDMNLKIKDLILEYIANSEAVNDEEKAIFVAIDEVMKEINNVLLKANESFFGKVQNYFRIILAIVLAVSFLGILISFFTARSLSRLLAETASGLEDASDQVASAAHQVSSSSQSLAEGSAEQAASLEEISSSLEEVASMSQRNSENATQADNLMKEAWQVIAEANRSMKELMESMTEISKASEETQKIVKTIDEISFQTNLLALNAAVEAARAGEAGAGFAVVADEVRNLALRAAEAAKQTAELIAKTAKKITDGSQLVIRTNDAFGRVQEGVSKVGELVGEIAAASKEQAEGIYQLNTAVSEMDRVVQQNAASAEENASASEEMNAQAEQMKDYVGSLVRLVQGSKNVTQTHILPPSKTPLRVKETKPLQMLSSGGGESH
mgnify:CR=1 FL=1